MPKKGERARKIELIRRGKTVRPPKRWWKKMRKVVRRQYPEFGARRINRITAGVWHDYSPSTQIVIIRKYQ